MLSGSETDLPVLYSELICDAIEIFPLGTSLCSKILSRCSLELRFSGDFPKRRMKIQDSSTKVRSY